MLGELSNLWLARINLVSLALIYLPERIGLKPLPCREKLKSDYSLLQSSSFQVEIAVNYQLSTVNCQLSTEKHPLKVF